MPPTADVRLVTRDRQGHRPRRRSGAARTSRSRGCRRPEAFDDRKGWRTGRRQARPNPREVRIAREADSEELAQLEKAKVASRSRRRAAEVIGASLVFDYYAVAANKVFGQTIPVSKPGMT